jgi:plasmid stabilization system protein ParE
MSLRAVRSPEALADIALQAEYYAANSGIHLAARFVEAVNSTVSFLALHPWIGKRRRFRHPRLQGLRFFLIQHPFEKHLIFYRVTDSDTVLDVFRVMHGARNLPHRLLNSPGAE